MNKICLVLLSKTLCASFVAAEIFLILASVPFASDASAESSFSAIVPEVQPWAFVSSVGGITIATTTPFGEKMSLPVNCDVSGLYSFSTPPSKVNSGLACIRTTATTRSGAVFVQISTGLPGLGAAAKCPPAEMKKLEAGTYSVYYGPEGDLDHQIGTIHVTR